MLSKRWITAIEKIDFAFQPIANIHTGITFGVEALLRNCNSAGFPSIRDLFDTAFSDQCLVEVDLLLREKALRKFRSIWFHESIKLFYNLDNRLVSMADYREGTLSILEREPIEPSNLCFEISEQDPWEHGSSGEDLLNSYKDSSFRIALDDFGSGFAGLQLLYRCEPHYVKMDRFFINGICSDARKKLFVNHTVNLAHTLGIHVVAEGIETVEEFMACCDVRCDFVQGYLVARPTTDISALLPYYENVRHGNEQNRRSSRSDQQLIRNRVRVLEPLRYPSSSLVDLLEFFRSHNEDHFVPVVNHSDEPLGIIHEKDLKEYVYSPFGRELLTSKRFTKRMNDFIQPVPMAELHSSIEEILEVYSVEAFGGECIFITENGKYYGVLTARTLLDALNEKNIATARDLNPLSRLPGNNLIHEYLCRTLLDPESSRAFIYFDFDNFKPFNDVYGFRTGDRVILLFSEILQRHKSENSMFIGHIGGDDFFMGIKNVGAAQAKAIAADIQVEFQKTIEGIYSDDHRQERGIHTKDRNGEMRFFELMRVSAAVIIVPASVRISESDRFAKELSTIKSRSKKSKVGISCRLIRPDSFYVINSQVKESLLTEKATMWEDMLDIFESEPMVC